MNEKKLLHPDRQTVAELSGVHMKWIRFLLIAETLVALLLTGTLLYGKESVKIMKKRMENQA